VQVAAALEGHHWLVEVQDDGPGIPAGQRERVFERFVRLQRGREGSGLGLSIVHRIAQLLKGTLDVCNGPDGRGTIIRFIVPLQR
jgi:signal transduction histidine kinase